MNFELYVDGELFFVVMAYKGADLLLSFIEEYEANHVDEMSMVEDEDNNTIIVDFYSYEDYLKFENALNEAG